MEPEDVQIELLQAQPQINTASDNNVDAEETDSALFDAIDDNGDGVLTREEFTKGYAKFVSDAASNTFDSIDDNGDGGDWLATAPRPPCLALQCMSHPHHSAAPGPNVALTLVCPHLASHDDA